MVTPAPSSSACCDTTCCSPSEAVNADVATASVAASAEALKARVRERYAQMARGEAAGCCDSTCCSPDGEAGFSEAYGNAEGYLAEADLGLGCGVPTQHAGLQPGQTVLDLGSGAGLDAFVARTFVGEEGHVIGVDMTPAMIERARRHTETLGYRNVTFLLGEIEALPLDDATVDVALSNCVLNLVPEKRQAFRELYRVLRPGGHFCISDVVSAGVLPEAVQQAAALHAGCIAGALERGVYLALLAAAGFTNVQVVTERALPLPDDVLRPYLTGAERDAFRRSGNGLLSVTVRGEKPC